MFSLERCGSRISLRGPEGRYSTYHPARVFTGMGWDAQSASALLVGRTPRKALLLGYGGGTVARQLRAMFPNIALTGVEIDAHIIRLAKRHFSSTRIGVTIIAGCGERFVRAARDVYDFVLDDMWDHSQRRSRAVIADPDWLLSVARRLTPNGVYAANIYARDWAPVEYDVAMNRMRRTFAAVTEVRVPHERVCVLAGSARPASRNRVAELLSGMPRSARVNLASVDINPC